MFAAIRNTIRYVRFHSIHSRPAVKIRSWQQERLRLLLPRLEKDVELYKKLLAGAGIHASDILSLDDFTELPVMGDDIFSGKYIEEYSVRGELLAGAWVMRRGRDGSQYSLMQRAIAQAPLYRDSLNYRYILEPWTLTTDRMRIAHISKWKNMRNNRITISEQELQKDSAEAAKRICEFQPDVIEATPAHLEIIAQEIARLRLSLRPKYALTGGAVLPPETRHYIEQTLGCEVYVRYSIYEFATVAMECRLHDGCHVHSESFIVEVVDEKGIQVPDGEVGRILVTDLLNDQVPYVRYDTGDRGRMVNAPCECGIECPRLYVIAHREQ